MRDAGSRAAKQLNSIIVELDAVRVPYVRADPAQRLDILRWRLTELLDAVGDVVVVFGEMGVQRDLAIARQSGGAALKRRNFFRMAMA